MISLKNIHDSTNTCIHEKYCRLMHYYCVLAKKALDIRHSNPVCPNVNFMNG